MPVYLRFDLPLPGMTRGCPQGVCGLLRTRSLVSENLVLAPTDSDRGPRSRDINGRVINGRVINGRVVNGRVINGRVIYAGLSQDTFPAGSTQLDPPPPVLKIPPTSFPTAMQQP